MLLSPWPRKKEGRSLLGDFSQTSFLAEIVRPTSLVFQFKENPPEMSTGIILLFYFGLE